MSEERGRFDHWAPRYDRSILQRLMFGPVHDAVLNAFSAAAAPPHDVLDVGCGTGRLLESAARRWTEARLTGIDASAAMVAEAQRTHDGDPRFAFKQGNASDLPLEAASWDAAFSTISFHHWGDQVGGIRSVARVLRPGGLFVLADVDVPFLSLWRPLFEWTGHVSFQGPPAIRRLMEQAGFSVVSQRRFWSLLRVQVVVARKN